MSLSIGLSWKITKIYSTPVLVSHRKLLYNSLKRVFCVSTVKIEDLLDNTTKEVSFQVGKEGVLSCFSQKH